jgi:hypothetical protein
MKPRRLLRPKQTWAKLGVGKTSFDQHYRFHIPDDPFVPGTEIPRLKHVPLGERNIAYLEHEADALIDALAELRDVGARTTQVFVESSRGWRLDKLKQAHKIDTVVALSMAALAAIRGQGESTYLSDLSWVSDRDDSDEAAADAAAERWQQERVRTHILTHSGYYGRYLWR